MAGLAKAGLVEAEYEQNIPFTDTTVSYKATKDEPLYMLRFDKNAPNKPKAGFIKVKKIF